MDVLQSIDVGLVVLDDQFTVQLWNNFMKNHSAWQPSEAIDQSIFEIFPELPEAWFRRKVQSVKVAHIRLCYSRKFFVVAYPRERLEMVFDAHFPVAR